MINILTEAKDELENLIFDLGSLFDEYEFKTASGLDKSCFQSLETFKALATTDNKLISITKFKKEIKHDFYTNCHESVKGFDWDEVESAYEGIEDKYQSYSDLCEAAEDNLTGDLSLDTVKVLTEADLKTALLELIIEQEAVYEINSPEHGIVYVLSADLQRKLN